MTNGDLSLAVSPALVEALAIRVAELVGVSAAPTEPADQRMALRVDDAAETIGVSPDHFTRHVLPDLKVIRSGRLRLIPVAELERWTRDNAARLGQ